MTAQTAATWHHFLNRPKKTHNTHIVISRRIHIQNFKFRTKVYFGTKIFQAIPARKWRLPQPVLFQSILQPVLQLWRLGCSRLGSGLRSRLWWVWRIRRLWWIWRTRSRRIWAGTAGCRGSHCASNQFL